MYYIKVITALCLLFSISNAYELRVNKVFENSIDSDRMELNFSFIAKKSSAKETKDILHPAIAKIKKHTQCSGGGYTLNPEYNYKSNKKELLGFIGRATFKCTFKHADEIDEVLASLDDHKELELQQNPIKWSVTKENLEIAKINLELRAIKYAKEYIEILKKENIAKCNVKNINILTDSVALYEAQDMLRAKNITQTPTKEPISLSVNANYSFECE